MSMFELNKDVPETLLPKNGKYSAVINKVEEKTSSKGSTMLAVEMTIYAFLLQGVPKRRRMAYAATANVVSAVLGFILTGVCDSFINML